MAESTQSLRGSESFPIEITDEEEAPNPVAEVQSHPAFSDQQLNKPLERIKKLENCFKKKKVKIRGSPKYLKHFDEINKKMHSLDQRIGKVEHCLNAWKALLSETDVTEPNDVLDEVESDVVLQDMAGTVTSPKQYFQDEGNFNSVNGHESQVNVSRLPHQNEVDGVGGLEMSRNSLSLEVNSVSNILDGHESGNSVLMSPITNEHVEEDSIRHENSINEELGQTESTDIKYELLPMLPSVKEELPLLRDDAGRILVFLCCAVRKLVGSEISVCVSGTFVQEQLHNEYIFTAKDTYKNLKMEAEMKSAMFGVELVRTLYPGEKDGVCIMFISSSPTLVKIMKGKSNEAVASTLSKHLNDLMQSLQSIQAHWCLPANISDEENKIMRDYEITVRSALDEAYKGFKQAQNFPVAQN